MYLSRLQLLPHLILLWPSKRQVILAKSIQWLLIRVQPSRVINLNHLLVVFFINQLTYNLMFRLYNTSTFPDHHALVTMAVMIMVVVKATALLGLTEVPILHSSSALSPIHSIQEHTVQMKTKYRSK